MSYHFFYKKLEQLARELFPSLGEISPPSWDHLISPLELRLPKSLRENASAAIRALHAVSRRQAYSRSLEAVGEISQHPTPNESVLMAYDFHSNEAGECFLVEINTNASGFLFSSLMEMTHSETAVASYPPLQALHAAFAEELRRTGYCGTTPAIAIVDEDVLGQKMYAEFLMYRDWFRSLGWQAEIADGGELTRREGHLAAKGIDSIDLVYNRLTDFYLESPENSPLREAFLLSETCVSPNPREYWLLADKQRLIQFSTPGFLAAVGASAEEASAIAKVLIPTFEKTAYASPEAIWSQRKTLFFKPKRSYGGKAVYRGESVSRKVFERLMSEDVLVQHFQPAQKVPTDDPRSVLSNWKFDLRFFVYGDQVQLCAARIYQGQVTNFASPLGGFTRVEFI